MRNFINPDNLENNNDYPCIGVNSNTLVSNLYSKTYNVITSRSKSNYGSAWSDYVKSDYVKSIIQLSVILIAYVLITGYLNYSTL